MIATASAVVALAGRMVNRLGRLPAWGWVVAGLIGVLLLGWRWHEARIATAYATGARTQAAADRQRIAAAATAAARAQHALKVALDARQTAISKGTEDALAIRTDDLAHRYDDLRLRWAAYRRDQGRSGQDRAIGLPGAAAGADDATCPAAGWVSFDTAAAAAEAADAAITKDDAWIAWAKLQAEAWPKD